jgi:hypothetical protein
MASTWTEVAAGIIAAAHDKLPPEADLKARKRALNEARTPFFRQTSWGRKCWEKAARNYLDQYRQLPPAGLPLFGPSPLERARAKAGVR